MYSMLEQFKNNINININIKNIDTQIEEQSLGR